MRNKIKNFIRLYHNELPFCSALWALALALGLQALATLLR